MKLEWSADLEFLCSEGRVVLLDRPAGRASAHLGLRAAVLSSVFRHLSMCGPDDSSTIAGVLRSEWGLDDSDAVLADLVAEGVLAPVTEVAATPAPPSDWYLETSGWDASDTPNTVPGLASRAVYSPLFAGGDLDRWINPLRSRLRDGDAILPIMTFRQSVAVGPLCLPDAMPCVKCAVDRQAVNIGIPLKGAKSLHSGAADRAPAGASALPIVTDLAFRIVQREVAVLQEEPHLCNLIGSILQLDDQDLSPRYDIVIQNPSCPICGLAGLRRRQ